MRSDGKPRSPFDKETKFTIIKSDTPRTVDGFKPGEPTGEIRCDACGRVAGSTDYIPHEKGCEQENVLSGWYLETHRVPEMPEKDTDT